MKESRYSLKRGSVVLAFMVFLLLAVSVISMNTGKMNLSPLEVWAVLLGKGTAKDALIVYEFRLPRIVLSILVGVGMGASGCIMQSLLRNDMASPGTLGISSGSGLLVLLYVVYFQVEGTGALAIPVLAFIGGITAAGLIFLLSFRKGKDISPTGLILTGVALGSGCIALTTLLTLRLDNDRMEFIQRWFAGSLWGADWKYLKVLIPWTVLLFFYGFYQSSRLNVLSLGNQTAAGLGMPVNHEFLKLSIIAVALSSGSVALGGNFFFAGMISPHMARKLVGSNHKLLLPGAAFCGAVVVLMADTIARTLSLGTDIPTGIVITVLSTPYFLYLLIKTG